MRNDPVSPVLQYNRQCCKVLCCVLYLILALTGSSPVLRIRGRRATPLRSLRVLITVLLPDDKKSAIAAPPDPDSVNCD